MTFHGPTLIRQLYAEGLWPLPIVIKPDNILGLDALPEEQRTAVQAVLDAYDPDAPIPREIPRKEFFKQLVRDEKLRDFFTWRDAQDEDTILYFLEEKVFLENDARVSAAMTALALTPSTFVTNALSHPPP